MHVTIESRFRGPPESGNGGYTCGLLAELFEGAVEVTLRAPPPLDTPLELERSADGARLLHQGRPVAEARPVALELTPPPSPGLAAAQHAAEHYAGFAAHAFPGCFTCGPARAPGDGLRIFSGPLTPGVVAAPWTADASMSGAGGQVRAPILWAALDCPGYFAIAQAPQPMLLGRMAGRLLRPIRPGDTCVVIGWAIGHEGRKHHAGTALYTQSGELAGYSRQTWVEPRA